MPTPPSCPPRRRRHPPGRRLSQGLTLIELMVSVAIGLVLVLTMLVLYTHVARSQTQLSNTGRQVENGKFALQLLQEDLRHAGFWGDYLPRYDDKGLAAPVDVPDALPNPCLAYSAANWDASHIRNLMGIAVQGYDEAPADCGTLLNNKADHTDVLLVRHVENCVAGQPNCDAETNGRLYFQSSRCSTEMANGNRFVLGTTGLTLKSNRDCPVATGADTLADKRRFVSHFYYVRNFSITASDGIPTLMRSSFNLSGASLAHQAPQALIEGIEGFRVEFGIDRLGSNGAAVNYDSAAGAINRGDGTPDVYITCPQIGTPPTACDVNDMFNAVSARVHVLARNLEPTPGHVDTKQYVLAGVTYGPFNDGFVRRAYSTTVRLMNPAGRREP